MRAGSGFSFLPCLERTSASAARSFRNASTMHPGRESDRGALDCTRCTTRRRLCCRRSGGRDTLIGRFRRISRSASAFRWCRTPPHWEVFNLFNATNFGQPDSNISNVTAGADSTADDARNMQFGIRLAWCAIDRRREIPCAVDRAEGIMRVHAGVFMSAVRRGSGAVALSAQQPAPEPSKATFERSLRHVPRAKHGAASRGRTSIGCRPSIRWSRAGRGQRQELAVVEYLTRDIGASTSIWRMRPSLALGVGLTPAESTAMVKHTTNAGRSPTPPRSSMPASTGANSRRGATRWCWVAGGQGPAGPRADRGRTTGRASTAGPSARAGRRPRRCCREAPSARCSCSMRARRTRARRRH